MHVSPGLPVFPSPFLFPFLSPLTVHGGSVLSLLHDLSLNMFHIFAGCLLRCALTGRAPRSGDLGVHGGPSPT